ncbi:MAG TPA: hypothetical protein VKE88_01995 [Candidatus Nanoarchaeia archaeon]|nr:hypothetical protein [Candidatus Nanoarchaeia archaeon]
MNFTDAMILFSVGFLISLVIISIVVITLYLFRFKIGIWFASKRIKKAIEALQAGKDEEERVANLLKAGITDYLIVQKAHEELKKQGVVIQNDKDVRQEAARTESAIEGGDKPRSEPRNSTPSRQRYIPPKTATFSRKN